MTVAVMIIRLHMALDVIVIMIMRVHMSGQGMVHGFVVTIVGMAVAVMMGMSDPLLWYANTRCRHRRSHCNHDQV
jgi:type IV secretory pathway TrbD component